MCVCVCVMGVPAGSCLESLSLKCCGLSGPSCPSLCRALSDNKTLLSLDLSCNRLCDEGAGHMASALRLNRCLVSLVLVDCGVGDEGARLLAQVGGRCAHTPAPLVCLSLAGTEALCSLPR